MCLFVFYDPVSDHCRLLNAPWRKGRRASRQPIDASIPSRLKSVQFICYAPVPPSLSALGLFCRWTWVSQYQSVSILDVIGDKSDGGGEW